MPTAESADRPGQPAAAIADRLRVVLDRLAQAPAFAEIARALEQRRRIVLDGVWPAATAVVTASLEQRFSVPLLVIVPLPAELDSLVPDLEFLLGRAVDIFPQASEDMELESLLQQEAVQRLQVLGRLEAYYARSAEASAGQPAAAGPSSGPPIVVTTLPALLHPVPSPAAIRSSRRVLAVGQSQVIAELRRWLIDGGYHSTTSVQLPGEFTFRGGILDIFPPDAVEPIRIEWFDEEIESIRQFDAITQKSISRLDSIALPLAKEDDSQSGSLLDYLAGQATILLAEPLAIQHHARLFLERIPFPERFTSIESIEEQLRSFANVLCMQVADTSLSETTVRLPLGNVERISSELEQLATTLDQAVGDHRQATVLCWNVGELNRMQELLASSQALADGRAKLAIGNMASGFEIVPDGPLVLAVNQMLKRHALRRATRKISSRAIDSFMDLRAGDLIVHLAHGIGIYRGLQLVEKHGQRIEHLELEFAEGTKLFVPSSKIDLIQRYIGGTKSQPKLAKIGGQAWVRQKKAAEEAVTDMAAELLEMQATRRSHAGIAFTKDTVWQTQFDTSFPYEETADQLSAIDATKADMTQSRPMDRLICGDVGFGKTEVAMRAAFKAVDSGYQVAVLVPTTVLAEQHYKTFRERMAEFPFDVAKLSRFSTVGQQKETLERLAKGQIDIVIGTHRLASADVDFFNLGLVIIDEEQRFGVSVKERLKQQRPNVDVLTLSATPIPRTLHMSLVGVRDISNLETPPAERVAIETKVVRFDDKLIRHAILRELNRGGQTYFVHNRIQDIGVIAGRLQRIIPEARLIIGHGQMPEHQLEQVMVDFIEHRYDILLSTTIIESGLDIPNANTIFVDDADRYGLAELHQLRGRVGRYKHQAYCYLLVDRHKHLNPDASRRMHAIEEYSHIGAGFGIAMRDLEIRGAGNLLGTQQSGHIAAVGYELYCQLLETAVRKLKRQAPKLSIDVEVQLPLEAFLPSEYVPEIRHKIDLYRRLSRIDDVRKLEDLRQEVEDRFGPLPPVVDRLLEIAELRIDATLWSVKSIGIEENFLVFVYGDRRRIEQLARRHAGRLQVLEQQKAYWSLADETRSPLELARFIFQPPANGGLEKKRPS